MTKMYRRHFLGMATEIARKATDRNIVIGPCLSHPQGGPYFVVARGMRNVALSIDTIKAQQGVSIEEVRAKLLLAFRLLASLRVHDVDDEEKAIERCRELWPCKQLDDMLALYQHEKAALKFARKVH